jgi:hypothetical protein
MWTVPAPALGRMSGFTVGDLCAAGYPRRRRGLRLRRATLGQLVAYLIAKGVDPAVDLYED